MLKEFISRVYYSHYYLWWKSRGFRPSIDLPLILITCFATLQFMALMQILSLISVLVLGLSTKIGIIGYLISWAAIYFLFWHWLGEKSGILEIVRKYGRQRRVSFKFSAEKYIFSYWALTMLTLALGLASAYFEGKITRGEFG